jgi:hypothetical protein
MSCMAAFESCHATNCMDRRDFIVKRAGSAILGGQDQSRRSPHKSYRRTRYACCCITTASIASNPQQRLNNSWTTTRQRLRVVHALQILLT